MGEMADGVSFNGVGNNKPPVSNRGNYRPFDPLSAGNSSMLH